jgi:uncharacterized cupin superfamily protein
MPYTVMRAGDAPNYAGDDPSPFLGYARPMEAQQLAMNLRELAPGATNVPPGRPPTGGHSHRTVEELYLVLDGEVTLKLDDELLALGPRDAVLIRAGTMRMARNRSDRPASLLMVSPQMEDPRGDSQWVDDFWPEET